MTAKAKAKYIFDKFYEIYPNTGVAIESAKEAINLILESINMDDVFREYWQDVEYQINQL